MAALKVIAKRSIQHDQDIYICFVDYEKAFDRVDWKKTNKNTEANGGGLERKKIDRQSIHGTKSKDKN